LMNFIFQNNTTVLKR